MLDELLARLAIRKDTNTGTTNDKLAFSNPPARRFWLLGEEEEALVDATLSGRPTDCVVASGPLCLQCTQRDIHTLKGARWINDEVMNLYLCLLELREGVMH